MSAYRSSAARWAPRRVEAELVGLAVHSHELLGELAQHRHRRAGATDVGPRTAGRAHHAPQQEFLLRRGVVEFPAGVADALGRGCPGLEHAAGRRRWPGRAGAHACGVGPAAEQQQQRR